MHKRAAEKSTRKMKSLEYEILCRRHCGNEKRMILAVVMAMMVRGEMKSFWSNFFKSFLFFSLSMYILYIFRFGYCCWWYWYSSPKRWQWQKYEQQIYIYLTLLCVYCKLGVLCLCETVCVCVCVLCTMIKLKFMLTTFWNIAFKLRLLKWSYAITRSFFFKLGWCFIIVIIILY